MKKISLLPLALFLTSCGPQIYEIPTEAYVPTLTTSELEESLALGAQFLLAHQTEAGNFDYEYNFATKATPKTTTLFDKQERSGDSLS